MVAGCAERCVPGSTREIGHTASGAACRAGIRLRNACAPRDVRALTVALRVQRAQPVDRRDRRVLGDARVTATQQHTSLTEGYKEQLAPCTEIAFWTKRLTDFAAMLHAT